MIFGMLILVIRNRANKKSPILDLVNALFAWWYCMRATGPQVVQNHKETSMLDAP